MPSFEFRDVVKTYDGKTAVAGVSFGVGAGEVFGLLGPNGAGKTTRTRMAMDIIRPDGGAIWINGRASFEADRDRVGYLPEERGLYRKQRVVDVLEYFGRLEGMTGAVARSRAREELPRAGLAEWEKKRVEHLSKGMQQKVQVIPSPVRWRCHGCLRRHHRCVGLTLFRASPNMAVSLGVSRRHICRDHPAGG